MVVIEVVMDRKKGYGYNLKHNQQPGFKGIIGNVWAWYRYKRDAIKAKDELTKCWN